MACSSEVRRIAGASTIFGSYAREGKNAVRNAAVSDYEQVLLRRQDISFDSREINCSAQKRQRRRKLWKKVEAQKWNQAILAA
jgi:hypothetical protein